MCGFEVWNAMARPASASRVRRPLGNAAWINDTCADHMPRSSHLFETQDVHPGFVCCDASLALEFILGEHCAQKGAGGLENVQGL